MFLHKKHYMHVYMHEGPMFIIPDNQVFLRYLQTTQSTQASIDNP